MLAWNIIIASLISLSFSFIYYTNTHAYTTNSHISHTYINNNNNYNSNNNNNKLLTLLHSNNNGNNDAQSSAEEDAERWRREAKIIREQAKKLEEALGPKKKEDLEFEEVEENVSCRMSSLRNKKVLVDGANGRLGSMVCRYLLRNNPTTKVLAAVHYVGESSTRGYGRLSYEVGAEDGQGQIGAAWSEERNASFMYSDDIMAGYNLQNLRVLDVELLDPVQCMTITEDVDSVIWCATDFNGNQPRAISGLNIAFLFRAVAAPTKGRVEIEGLTNILGGLKNGKQSKLWDARKSSSEYVARKATNDPCSFVLVSTAEDALEDFVTPLGDFKALKRDGERILQEDFPSLSYTILQMGRYDENFVDEGLDVQYEEPVARNEDNPKNKRKINRRDAAKAAVEALTDESLLGKKVEVFTVER